MTTEYDTYNVRVEVEGLGIETEMEIPRVYRGSEQEIYNWIMDSVMLEWDFVGEYE